MSYLTVTLNTAIDATYVVEGFAHGGTNRVLRRHIRPGGKGNNVARVLAALGEEVTATGFLAGHAGREIEAGLREAEVATRFGWLPEGESRTCHTILEQDTGVATEILEAGPVIGEGAMAAMLAALDNLAARAGTAIVSGSAPPGAAPAFLENLARLVRRGAARFVVDSSGPALQALLTARPDLVKPNEAELGQLMGRPAPLAEQIAWVRDDLIRTRLAPGARVILSRGREGAVLITADRVLAARPPAVPVVNTVGCGDALLAGFARTWASGASDAEALCAGVATGTAAALEEVAGEVEHEAVCSLRARVELRDDWP